MFTPGTVALQRPEGPGVRLALRLLGMVHELHKVGYQRLRIEAGWSPSGLHWRCNIHPAHPVEGIEPARYTSADGAGFFRWSDVEHATAREMATKFVERFPDLCAAGAGLDFAYAGWMTSIVGMAESGALPIFFADYPIELDPTYWPPPPPPA